MSDIINKLNYANIKVIACATVIEEMLPMMPPELKYQKLEFGLHSEPDKLRAALQEAIDATEPQMTTILLGYGLCSRAVAGLKSDTRTLVIPKVDDCIAIFLGSDAEYKEQHRVEPGTLYQTKGWIEADKSLKGLPDMVKKYGEKRAKWLFKQMIKNYTRMAFINTGNYEIERYRTESRSMAAELDLKYEEIEGSNRLVKKLLVGPWDDEFVVAPPGHALTFLDFRTTD
jgi:hypothetical protein